MAELRIERDALPGRQGAYWREPDGTVVVLLGRELDEFGVRRIVRAAEREHGLQHRRWLASLLIPIPGATQVREAVRDHPATTFVITGVVGLGLALTAIGGLPNGEGKQPRRRPPTVAGPAPTHGPATAVPPPRRAPAPAPSAGRGVVPSPGAPGAGNGTVHPRPRVDHTPATPADEPTPAAPPSESPGTELPAEPRPPENPPPVEPGQDPCLLYVDVLELAELRAVCI